MFRWFLPTLAAVLAGLLVLLGALIPVPAFVSARAILLQGATAIGAFALVLAFGNLLRVHIGRIIVKETPSGLKQKHRLASVILVLSALLSLALVLAQGPDGQTSRVLMEAVLIPGQSALLALTAVTLVVAGMRLYQVRRHLHSVLFLIAALLALLTAGTGGLLPRGLPIALQSIADFVNSIATGGMRGLLLGVAIGTIIAGLRVILTIDRPHSPRRTISR
jgi:hypothetical protein